MSKNTKPAKAKEVPQQVVAGIAPHTTQVLIFDASTEGKDSKSFHYEVSVPSVLVSELRVLFKRVEEVESLTENLTERTIEAFWDPSYLVGTGLSASALKDQIREATDPNGVRYWSLACAALAEVHPEKGEIAGLEARRAEALARKDASEADNLKAAIDKRDTKRRRACKERLDAMVNRYAQEHADKNAPTEPREKLTARSVIELAIADFNDRANKGEIAKLPAEKALLLRAVDALRAVLADTYRAQSSIFEAPTSVAHRISDKEPAQATQPA